MMGGAVGLAILASLAASRTNNQLASGVDSLAALNSGYHLAFLVGAVFLMAAGSVGAALLRVEMPQAHGAEAAHRLRAPRRTELPYLSVSRSRCGRGAARGASRASRARPR